MSDSDSGQKKPGVPSWQLQLKDTSAKEAEKVAPEPPNRETVIEQAKKFLEEDEVKNESTDKKIAFLESKGLQNEEIQDLLGITRNPEATAPAPSPSQTPSTTSPPLPPAQSPPPSQTRRDTPPIITYPEFLTTSPSPGPLVTRRRLLTTLYLFSGLSALLYGTQNYLVAPMLSSLTTSRLSLSETARKNLQKLTEKLEAVVSEIPPSAGHGLGKEDGHADREEEESDEDPTEMFHRDIGTQTCSPSQPSSLNLKAEALSVLDEQTSRLSGLKSSLSELVEDSTGEGQEISDLSATVAVLREYLDGLAYVMPNFGFGGIGGFGGGRVEGEKDDEIAKVKAGIRGVKGVLLNARSFPGGGGSVGRVR